MAIFYCFVLLCESRGRCVALDPGLVTPHVMQRTIQQLPDVADVGEQSENWRAIAAPHTGERDRGRYSEDPCGEYRRT